jgi:hypothetical protein
MAYGYAGAKGLETKCQPGPTRAGRQHGSGPATTNELLHVHSKRARDTGTSGNWWPQVPVEESDNPGSGVARCLFVEAHPDQRPAEQADDREHPGQRETRIVTGSPAPGDGELPVSPSSTAPKPGRKWAKGNEAPSSS